MMSAEPLIDLTADYHLDLLATGVVLLDANCTFGRSISLRKICWKSPPVVPWEAHWTSSSMNQMNGIRS